MANVENILKVADAIEKHSIADLGFNMGEVVDQSDEWTKDLSGHDCGTVACIAGWAISIEHGLANGREALNFYLDEPFGLASAGAFLGLEPETWQTLFLGVGAPASLDAIEPDQAVRTLRSLAATGKVDWTA